MPYGDYHGAWRAMEELYKAGKIRAIGDFELTADDLAKIHHMDHYKPLILDIASIDEVRRLHGITFEQ